MVTKIEALKVLNENILKFWQSDMVDAIYGGFHGRIDGHGVLYPKAEKGVILNTRILWTFSAAYPITGNPRHKLMADRAYEYLVKYFVDVHYGGVYWMLDHIGQVVNDKKQIYAQAFAIYALAEYHKINPYRRALDHAVRLYEKIEERSFDPIQNGYFEAFDREWKPLADVRLSEKDMQATKTMNTHLHILEAYTNLLSVWPNLGLKKQLRNLIELMSDQFLYENGHFKLFFDDDWNLLSDEYSFGHDIEGAWLLCEAAEMVNDLEITEDTNEKALLMTKAALEGLDEDGGLMYEATDHGLKDTDKHWWPQAEALVGLMNAYEITGDKAYLEAVDRVWRFTRTKLIDMKAGEWHWKVSRSGELSREEDKAGPWKCPYHNGRAMLELYRRLEK